MFGCNTLRQNVWHATWHFTLKICTNFLPSIGLPFFFLPDSGARVVGLMRWMLHGILPRRFQRNEPLCFVVFCLFVCFCSGGALKKVPIWVTTRACWFLGECLSISTPNWLGRRVPDHLRPQPEMVPHPCLLISFHNPCMYCVGVVVIHSSWVTLPFALRIWWQGDNKDEMFKTETLIRGLDLYFRYRRFVMACSSSWWWVVESYMSIFRDQLYQLWSRSCCSGRWNRSPRSSVMVISLAISWGGW